VYKLAVGLEILDPAGHDEDLLENPEFTRNLFVGLKINKGGDGFRPFSERMKFLNCLNGILPQMLETLPITGPVVSKGFWTSLSDWIGANSFDHANKDTRWKKFFLNTDSAIAQEPKAEISRVTRLVLDALQPLGRDPAKEAESPVFNRLGVGMLSSVRGFKSFRGRA
jgi:hypothetical protein